MTFIFDFSHFDHITDRLSDGLTVTLEKENGSKLSISEDKTEKGDDIYSIILQAPNGLPLQADQVFYSGELFNFLQGLRFSHIMYSRAN